MTFLYSIINRKKIEKLLTDAGQTIYALNYLREIQDDEMEVWKQLCLLQQQNIRDLVVAFRIALEQPEIDIRDDLEALIREVEDGLARIEEQVVI